VLCGLGGTNLFRDGAPKSKKKPSHNNQREGRSKSPAKGFPASKWTIMRSLSSHRKGGRSPTLAIKKSRFPNYGKGACQSFVQVKGQLCSSRGERGGFASCGIFLEKKKIKPFSTKYKKKRGKAGWKKDGSNRKRKN